MSGESDSEATFSEPEAPGSIEDRTQHRHGVDISVTVDSDTNFYAGRAMNLSSGGVFVATSIVHPVGTQFNLSIHIDDGLEGVIRGIGEVRWIRAKTQGGTLPQGLGIRFLDIYEDGSERIEHFLEMRAPMVVD